MEVFGKSPAVAVGSANVIYLSAILGRDGSIPVHKCDWKCGNENVCGNMYRCKLTGLTHVCDKNCNQRILYDNHSSLCRASGRIFPLSPAEEQAVKGIRRKLDTESQPSDSCMFKRRRRDAPFQPSPFERSSCACSGGGQLRAGRIHLPHKLAVPETEWKKIVTICDHPNTRMRLEKLRLSFQLHKIRKTVQSSLFRTCKLALEAGAVSTSEFNGSRFRSPGRG